MVMGVDEKPILRCCHNCMVMSVGMICRRCGRLCNDVDVGMPSYFKVKLPARGTEELDRIYSFLFDELVASWAGRVGHYAYVDEGDEHQLATNQDGFLYCFIGPDGWMRRLTADSRLGDPYYPEVVL